MDATLLSPLDRGDRGSDFARRPCHTHLRDPSVPNNPSVLFPSPTHKANILRFRVHLRTAARSCGKKCSESTMLWSVLGLIFGQFRDAQQDSIPRLRNSNLLDHTVNVSQGLAYQCDRFIMVFTMDRPNTVTLHARIPSPCE